MAENKESEGGGPRSGAKSEGLVNCWAQMVIILKFQNVDN